MIVGEFETQLPGIITAIKPQKKRRGRSSIFVDNQFLIGVDNDVVLNHDLQKGREMTSLLFDEIQDEEGKQSVKSYLLKLLSRRDHSRKELYTKASRKDFAKSTINGVLDELEQKGYINNRKFAEKFSRDKNNLNSWGPLKIKVSLRRKGIPGEMAEQVITETFKNINLEEQLADLITKRRKHFMREDNALKRKKKIADYLRRKGYYGSDVYQHLDSLATIVEQSDE